jgi:starvation-inducible DNA-binding protein
MEELLKGLLSDTVALKFKAHGYHWNVEGKNFHQFHELFSDIYTDYESAIDTIAEWSRKLGYLATSDLLSFYNSTTVTESISSTDPCEMAQDLLESNLQIGNKFQGAVTIATSAGQHALANFFAERMDQHQRWNWQLSATVKEIEMD